MGVKVDLWSQKKKWGYLKTERVFFTQERESNRRTKKSAYEKCIQNFGYEPWKEKTHLEDQGIERRIILK
jgi:hypothetical protein